jgi:hypothetical protein
MRDVLHFLDSEQDMFQRQARQRRSCSRRAPSKVVTRQSNSDAADSLSRVIFQPHAQVFDIDLVLLPSGRFLHRDQRGILKNRTSIAPYKGLINALAYSSLNGNGS